METEQSKHTPGPWLKNGNTIYALMRHTFKRGFETFRNRFSATVHTDEDISYEEAQSNINLIHAAPDMYAALKEAEAGLEIAVKTILQMDPSRDWSKSSPRLAYECVVEAIRKAEGGNDAG